MRNISSTVLSLAAMVLSSLTTYLTFFDARYTLTAVVADTTGQVSIGSGSNGETKSVNYRFWIDNSLIMSNRGTRAIVVSDIAFVKSADLSSCKVADQTQRMRLQVLPDGSSRTEYIKPFIVEPGSVQAIQTKAGLETIDQEVKVDSEFKIEPVDTLWCLEWTLFDPNGKRHQNLMPAFEQIVRFEMEEEGDRYPAANLTLEKFTGPTELLTRGLF